MVGKQASAWPAQCFEIAMECQATLLKGLPRTRSHRRVCEVPVPSVTGQSRPTAQGQQAAEAAQ